MSGLIERRLGKLPLSQSSTLLGFHNRLLGATHPGGGFVDDGLVLGEGGDESLEG